MGSYGILMIISGILNAILGGGLLITIKTLKSKTKEAAATARNTEALAEGSELTNVEKAIKIWREVAEKMSEKSTVLSTQVEALTEEVNRYSIINSKIIVLLDQANTSNLECIINEIKTLIEK
jgi:putative NADH-flavin reductase